MPREGLAPSGLARTDIETDEEVEDVVNALLSAGDKVSLTYDDANDTLTIDTSALDTEEVEDAVNALLTAGNATTLTYDDANDTLTVGVNESGLSFYDGTNLTADVDNSSVVTEDASIANAPTQDDDAARRQEISQVGSVTKSGNSGQADDGWDTGAGPSASASFGEAFDSAPVVVVSKDRDNATVFKYDAYPFNISTTGFDVQFINYSTEDQSSDTLAAAYTASEGRP